MQCAYCKNDLNEGSLKCHHCLEYTSGLTCHKCHSSLPREAVTCKNCGATLKRAANKTKKLQTLDFKCELLPTILFRGRLIPQEVETDIEKISVKAYGPFWLWCNTDEIPWNKVAGFSYRSGIIWDKIEIETRGQKPSVIVGIKKENGAKIRAILQDLEK